jgi:phosphate transporter
LLALPLAVVIIVHSFSTFCVGAMGLPVSGFPNMTAISIDDAVGQPWLTTRDFLVVGVPCSIFAYAIICTLGYFLMTLIGF